MERIMGRKYGLHQKSIAGIHPRGVRINPCGHDGNRALNVGLNENNIGGWSMHPGGNERFAYDAYRRLIMMYADVVMEKSRRHRT